MPIIQQYESHPITRDLGGIMTLFPVSRTVEGVKTPPAGIVVTSLARTSPESWGETNKADLDRGVAKPDPQDIKGPLAVAAVATVSANSAAATRPREPYTTILAEFLSQAATLPAGR